VQDDDGVSPTVEDSAPNNGDGNGDGVADAQQNNVSSLVGSNNDYVTLAAPAGTTISDVSIAPESSQAASDSSHSYPFGLQTFTVAGVTPGATVEINVYFQTTQDARNFVGRKLSGTTYSTLDGASILNVTLGSNTGAVKLTYGIADGGPLDHDGVANGSIVDPVGLATANTLAATGANSANDFRIAVVVLLAGLVFAVVGRKRRLIYGKCPL
jgi:hypothetical protein